MRVTNDKVRIKSYTLKELAAIYGISPRTMKKWLSLHAEVIGPKVGWYFTILQVKIIFEKLGTPGEVREEE